MYISNDPNVWVVYGLVLLLGLLLGIMLTSGGRKKWKTRYYDEVARREALEAAHAEEAKGWRERDSLRDAAARDSARTDARAAFVDRDRDGVDDRKQ
jgi:hypothetical protein